MNEISGITAETAGAMTPLPDPAAALAELDATQDPAILALAGRIGYRADPNSPLPRSYSGELVVQTTDGCTLRHREEINRGALERPLSNEDILAKYHANAAFAASLAA